jgi:hypothetical protein
VERRFSQYDEDDVLEKLFDKLGVHQGRFVEFGAWDGIYLSNTYRLVVQRGWRGLLIEADPRKFAELEKNMAGYDGVICLNRLVGLDPPEDLDSILASTDMPSDFDLLSIDIDGNDYHVWEGLKNYSPKAVVIEYNLTIPNHVEFVQARDLSVHHGNSLLAMTNLGKRKGYELIGTTWTNAFFCRGDLYGLVGMEDNSIDAVRPHRDWQTDIFQLYDGTITLAGNRKMLWHDIDVRDADIQVLPRPLRGFPPDYSPLRRLLMRLWWRYRKTGRTA